MEMYLQKQAICFPCLRYCSYNNQQKKAKYICKYLHFFYPFQVSDFFAKLIQRVSPKSYQQAFAEVYVTQKFLENFSSDQVGYTYLSLDYIIFTH